MDIKEIEARQRYKAYGWSYPEPSLILDEVDKDIIHNHSLTVQQWDAIRAFARRRQQQES